MIWILLLCAACFGTDNQHYFNLDNNTNNNEENETTIDCSCDSLSCANCDWSWDGVKQWVEKNKCCVGATCILSVIAGGVTLYVKYEQGQIELYNQCPHTVSVVPAQVKFINTASELCITAAAASIEHCKPKIANFVKKCISTSGYATGKTDSCTKEDQKEIADVNDYMLAEIKGETFWKPSFEDTEFPSGFKVLGKSSPSGGLGYQLRFISGSVSISSGCLDQCELAQIQTECGDKSEMKIDQQFALIDNDWTMTFPHLKLNGGNFNIKVSEHTGIGKYFEYFVKRTHTVKLSDGKTGSINVTYLDGTLWYHICKFDFSSWMTSWDSRCNPYKMFSLSNGSPKAPIKATAKLGDMEWVTTSTFSYFNFLYNGVMQTNKKTGSTTKVLSSTEKMLADDTKIEIHVDAVDPMAIVSTYITNYYAGVIETAYKKAYDNDHKSKKHTSFLESELEGEEQYHDALAEDYFEYLQKAKKLAQGEKAQDSNDEIYHNAQGEKAQKEQNGFSLRSTKDFSRFKF